MKKKKLVKKPSPYKGLALGIIIILAALVLFGLVATYRSASLGPPVPIPTSTPIPSPSPTITPDPNYIPYKEATKHAPKRAVVENGYAIIPELGIKFKVNEDLQDLIYSYSSYYGPEFQNYGTSSVGVSTQQLIDLDSRGCSSSSSPIGYLGKRINYPNGASGPQAKNIKKLGDNYYYYLRPQALCTNIKSAEILQGEQIHLLEQAFQSVELIK